MKKLEKLEKSIVCQPIDDYVAEMLGEGYYYCISITRDYGPDYVETEGTDWFIHPNGTFSGGTSISYPNEPPEETDCFSGTFEKSKYNDFVKQMQEFKEGWLEELNYIDEQQYDEEFSGYGVEVDDSELPF